MNKKLVVGLVSAFSFLIIFSINNFASAQSTGGDCSSAPCNGYEHQAGCGEGFYLDSSDECCCVAPPVVGHVAVIPALPPIDFYDCRFAGNGPAKGEWEGYAYGEVTRDCGTQCSHCGNIFGKNCTTDDDCTITHLGGRTSKRRCVQKTDTQKACLEDIGCVLKSTSDCSFRTDCAQDELCSNCKCVSNVVNSNQTPTKPPLVETTEIPVEAD